MDASDFDFKEMRRRAQARIDWDGGGPLPKDVPPEVIVAMIDESESLRGGKPEKGVVEKILQLLQSPEVRRLGDYHIGADEAVDGFLEGLAEKITDLFGEATSSPSKERKLEAWIIEHNSHGEVYDTPIWLPAGDKPDDGKLWVRAPWLDGTR